MTTYVMHLAGNQPAGYFVAIEGSRPWLFSGYVRMNAVTEEEAEAEFKAAYAAWNDER